MKEVICECGKNHGPTPTKHGDYDYRCPCGEEWKVIVRPRETKELFLECSNCGHKFGTHAEIKEVAKKTGRTAVPCPRCRNGLPSFVSFYKEPEPSYPPLPTKEKTDRELLLEVLERVKKLEEEVEHIKGYLVL